MPKSLFTELDEKIDQYKMRQKMKKQKEQKQQQDNNTSLF